MSALSPHLSPPARKHLAARPASEEWLEKKENTWSGPVDKPTQRASTICLKK